MIFVAILCKLQVEKPGAWGWGDIYEHIGYSVEQLKIIAAQYYPPAVQAVNDAESKTTQSIVINLTAFMSDVYEMALAWQNAKEQFSFTQWWRDEDDRRTVILQGSGEFKTLAGGYISSIINTIAQLTASPSFPESKTRRNVIIIDEMAQLPKLAGVEKFLEIGRSKGCSAIFATQSPAQLRKIYGADDLSSWFAMVGSKIFVRITGADDAEIALKELGTREVLLPTISSTGTGGAEASSVTAGWQREPRPVVRADELAALGPQSDGIAAVVAGLGRDPIRVVFPYIDTPAVRVAIIDNPDFNTHVCTATATTTRGDDAAAAAPTPVTVNNEYIMNSECIHDGFIEDLPTIDITEPPADPEDEDPLDSFDGEAIDEALTSPVLSAVLGAEVEHLLKIVQELGEASEIEPGSDVIQVNAPAQPTKKRLRVRKKTSYIECDK